MKTPGGPPPQDQKAFEIEAATKRFKESVDRMLLRAPEEETIDMQAAYLIDQLKKRSHVLLPEQPEEMAAFIQNLRTLPVSNTEVMSQEFASKSAQFFLSKMTAKEFQKRLQEAASAVEQNKLILTNEMVSYGVVGDSLEIHIPTQLDEERPNTRETIKRWRLFKEGLRSIASLLRTEPEPPEFAGVTRIEAKSHILYDSPYLLKDLKGFISTYRDEKIQEAGAEINREKFVKQYGTI